jgi:hypothetical protein
MNRPRLRLFVLLCIAILLFAACNMPRGEPTASGVDLINTAAAETVAARLTQAAQPPATQAGVTPLPTNTVPAAGIATATTGELLPTATTSAGTAAPTATEQVACDRVEFVNDVTYPDNTEVAAGQTFVKTWRLENAGSCTWSTAYSLVFAGKDRLEAPEAVPLPASVAPGQRIDISVTLKAPDAGGTFRSDFKLRNAAGQTFGIGPGNEPFYVQVRVPVASGVVFDFLAQASQASWGSGASGVFNTGLTFGGAETDPNGAALIKDGVKLETGAVSGKVLLTVPKADPNGSIAGTYPAYRVQNGDRLRARLAFMTNADGNCGVGNVVFQILYKEGGENYHLLGKWEKSCTGSVTNVDLDLSGLRGQTVQFVFIVDANGSSQDDWAIWNSARVEHE